MCALETARKGRCLIDKPAPKKMILSYLEALTQIKLKELSVGANIRVILGRMQGLDDLSFFHCPYLSMTAAS